MEDEGSGGRSPGQDGDRATAVVALAPFSPPRRAKTVRMSEAFDFIIPYAANQGRSSGFDAGEGTRPFHPPPLLCFSPRISTGGSRFLISVFFAAVATRAFAGGLVGSGAGARTRQRRRRRRLGVAARRRSVRGRAAGHAGLHPEERRAAQGRAARALLRLSLAAAATARSTWRRR